MYRIVCMYVSYVSYRIVCMYRIVCIVSYVCMVLYVSYCMYRIVLYALYVSIVCLPKRRVTSTVFIQSFHVSVYDTLLAKSPRDSLFKSHNC